VDLQSTTDEECCIKGDTNPVHLLLALRYLKGYPTEGHVAAISNDREDYALLDYSFRKEDSAFETYKVSETCNS
jgi:hypothetical protein